MSCACDLRWRRWNPNTGKCETCGSHYDRSADRLTWQAERDERNQQGLCARKACDSPHENLVHRDSGLKYCQPCAKLINHACNIELVAAVPTT